MHKTSELSMHALENSFFFFQIIHSSVKNRTFFVLKCKFYFCLGMMKSIGQGRIVKQIKNNILFITQASKKRATYRQSQARELFDKGAIGIRKSHYCDFS